MISLVLVLGPLLSLTELFYVKSLFCDWIFLFLLAGGSVGHSFSQKAVCCMFELSMIFFHWMFHYPGTHLDPHPYHL